METINPQALDWLLKEDKVNAPDRFLTLRDIFDRQNGDAELESTRSAAMETGLILAIMAEQYPEGYWENNKGIYGPKYLSTVWQVIMLAAAVSISTLMSLTRRNIPFALVLVWAFTGIAAKFPTMPLVNIASWAAARAVILILVFALLSKPLVGEE